MSRIHIFSFLCVSKRQLMRAQLVTSLEAHQVFIRIKQIQSEKNWYSNRLSVTSMSAVNEETTVVRRSARVGFIQSMWFNLNQTFKSMFLFFLSWLYLKMLNNSTFIMLKEAWHKVYSLIFIPIKIHRPLDSFWLFEMYSFDN